MNNSVNISSPLLTVQALNKVTAYLFDIEKHVENLFTEVQFQHDTLSETKIVAVV